MKGSKDIQNNFLLERARRFCAYQERSAFDVRRKLHEWKVTQEAEEKIIRSLIEEDFLNEERFARVFAGGKFRIKKWGKNKIMAELRARNISDDMIEIGLGEINEDHYEQCLKEVMDKKKELFEDPDTYENRNKIFNYLAGRGFEKYLIIKYL